MGERDLALCLSRLWLFVRDFDYLSRFWGIGSIEVISSTGWFSLSLLIVISILSISEVPLESSYLTGLLFSKLESL